MLKLIFFVALCATQIYAICFGNQNGNGEILPISANDAYPIGQTFVPDYDGTLQSITVTKTDSNYVSVNFYLYSGLVTSIGGTSLASVTDYELASGNHTITFSPAPAVTYGQTYTILVQSTFGSSGYRLSTSMNLGGFVRANSRNTTRDMTSTICYGTTTPSRSPSPSSSVSPSPSRTPSPSASSSVSPSRTPSPSSSPSSSPSVTPSPSYVPSASVTPSASAAASPSTSASASATPSASTGASQSPSPSNMATPSVTPSASAASTPSVTPSPSVVPSPSNAASSTPTPSVIPSESPSPSTVAASSSPSSIPSPSSSPAAVSPSSVPSTSSVPSASPSTVPSPSSSPNSTQVDEALSSGSKMQLNAIFVLALTWLYL